VKLAQPSKQVLRAVSAEHLSEDERQHADGKRQLQNEEGDSFLIRAHVGLS
jgi:hypothetical protein